MALNYTHRGHVDGAPGATTAVSGPIPVLADEILAISVNADSYSGTIASIFAYTTSPDWGFTQRVDYDEGIGGYCGIFALRTLAALSPVIHVEVTGTGSPPAGHRRPSFDIWTITGADLGAPVLKVDRTGFAGRNGNLIFRSTAGSPGNTLALIAAVDVLHNSPPYVYGDGITPGFGFQQSGAPGPPGVSGFGTVARWATPDQAYNTAVNLGTGYSPNPTCLATVMEFRPAPVAPTVDAGSDRIVERTKGIIRTAGEASDGGAAITARQWRLMSGPAGSGAPVDLPAYQGDPKRCLLPSTVAGNHTIRYTATNLAGPGFDEATITVTPLRPAVNAGPDATIALVPFSRTATESNGDAAITVRQWRIAAGPSNVGDPIGTNSATLSNWLPPSLGQWTLSYTATSTAGMSDPDLCVITVGVSGVPIRIGSLSPLFAVAIAFNGDLTDPDGSSWVFTEVTTDVRVEQGVHVRHGKGDEASRSQPAHLTLTLDNRHGKYSLGGRSPYWPNVRQGTPVEVSVNRPGGVGWQTIFKGYADGFTPNYSTRPMRPGVAGLGAIGDSTVTLSASGTMRRMLQGQPPVVSPMRRGLAASTGVVAYWPCEDGKGARLIASAFPGAPGMDFSGRMHGGSNPGLPAATPRLAESEVFVCSNPLLLVNDSECYGTVPDYPVGSPNVIQLRFLIDVPAPGLDDRSGAGNVIIGLITTGDPSFWELRYKANGIINVRAWRNFTTTTGGLDADYAFNVNGKRGQMGLTLTQSGTSVNWQVDLLEVGATGAGQVNGTIANATVGKATRVQTTTDGSLVDMTLGHIVVRKVARNAAENIRHLNAWTGENVGERLLRLTQENVLPYVQYDPPGPFYPTISDLMGPQPAGTVLDLYRDCETTDQGILWDGVNPGLSYTTKRYREGGPSGTGAPKLVLDAAQGHVGLPFAPVHDDAYRVNRAAAARREGASAVYEDAGPPTGGPLGWGIVGRYEDSLTTGCRDDTALVQYAGWMVGQGTVEGYRYPRLSLDLVATPQFLAGWLTVIPGDRVDVLNVSAVNPAAPAEDLPLAVEGYEQTITSTTWTVTMNTSLWRRWAVACVAAETVGGAGDPRPELTARVDTDGTVIATLTAVGQTTLTVDVTAGPQWSTNPGDYPLTLNVGAVAVRATACSAPSGARQTFTIDPMPVSRPATTPVRLWQPPVYGL